jgi:hypothetical protein
VVRIGEGDAPAYQFDPTSCPPELARAVLESFTHGGGKTRIVTGAGDDH